MRKQRKYETLSHLLSAKWLMEERTKNAVFPMLMQMLNGTIPSTPEVEVEDIVSCEKIEGAYFVSDWAEAAPPEAAPADSVAIIPIKGVITKYDQWWAIPGMVTKANHLTRALNNSNIVAVVIDMDSGGGQGSAVEILADVIAKANKPVLVFVNGLMCSAAYGLGCPAKEIWMFGRTSEAGSLGAYVPFVDFTGYYKELGIDVRDIYANKSKLKNFSHREAMKGNDKPMQDDLDVYTGFLTDAVAKHRKSLSKNPAIFQGDTFYSEDSVKEGLADNIGSLDDVVARAIELANLSAPDPNVNNPIFNMKFSFKTAWSGLMAFFALTPQAGQDTIEHEVSQEDWEKLNNQIAENASLSARVTELESQLTAEKTAHTTSKTSLETVTADRDAWKTKYEAKPAAAPIAGSTKTDPDTPDTTPEPVLSASHQAAMNTLTDF